MLHLHTIDNKNLKNHNYFNNFHTSVDIKFEKEKLDMKLKSTVM